MSEKQKREVEFVPRACPVCGGTVFEEGTSSGTFLPGTGFWRVRGGKAVAALRCLTCNYLLHYVSESLSQKSTRISWTILVIAMLSYGLCGLIIFLILQFR